MKPILPILFLFLFLYACSPTPAPRPLHDEDPMYGFVDMHAHPRADLAYGEDLFFGKPYGDISKELNGCYQSHGMLRGNIFRSQVALQTETMYYGPWVDGHDGYPDFKTWPAWCSVMHQQMWIDWIKRAHEGGLNIMVALVAHSHCISDAGETTGPYDDETVMENGIKGIKEMVAYSDFMEIAYSPKDARRIVAKGKLAVVLGLEMENIGNFYNPAYGDGATYNPNPTEKEIAAEIDKLLNLGVRYIFPVHITNNIFGGTALQIAAFNVPNKYNTGAEFIPEEVNTAETGIGFKLTHPIETTNPEANVLAKIAIRLNGGILPKSVNPSIKKNYSSWPIKAGYGHRNSLGLTAKGRFAIGYMMKKGLMIDIDHMSEKMCNEVLEIAVKADYPVNSGHSHPRGTNDAENAHTVKQYEMLRKVGGMIGLGHGENATDFVHLFRTVAALMGNTNIGIGVDAGGFYPLPKPDSTIKVTYDNGLVKCSAGNRTWDINIDGMAHYGLLPDFIRSWEVAGMTREEKHIFMRSAEHFTQMWEKCEERKSFN